MEIKDNKEDIKKEKIVGVRLTEEETELFKKFCSDKSSTPSKVLRKYILSKTKSLKVA